MAREVWFWLCDVYAAFDRFCCVVRCVLLAVFGHDGSRAGRTCGLRSTRAFLTRAVSARGRQKGEGTTGSAPQPRLAASVGSSELRVCSRGHCRSAAVRVTV